MCVLRAHIEVGCVCVSFGEARKICASGSLSKVADTEAFVTSVALGFGCSAVMQPVMSEVKSSGSENLELCGMQPPWNVDI